MLSARTSTLLACGLLACGGLACGSDGGVPSAQPSAAHAPVLVPPSAVNELSAESEMSTRPMELLKFTWTSGVDARNPVDVLTTAKPGTKAYAHLTVRNRTGRARKLTMEFRVNGKKQTTLELDVDESWSWRTWGYNTVPKDAKGTLELVVTDDEGHPLVESSLPIGP